MNLTRSKPYSKDYYILQSVITCALRGSKLYIVAVNKNGNIVDSNEGTFPYISKGEENRKFDKTFSIDFLKVPSDIQIIFIFIGSYDSNINLSKSEFIICNGKSVITSSLLYRKIINISFSGCLCGAFLRKSSKFIFDDNCFITLSQ
eukprot:GHVP01039341.1.p1 GENE.GHVP01039341.1~~GHVP01039341.1.p1  ORF type:complete len:147 (-),score=14.09 GHVP01039341.1:101-541(-)